MGGARCDKQQIGKTVARRRISLRKLKARPRQSACCPAVWSDSVGSAGVPFLTRIYFSLHYGSRSEDTRDGIRLVSPFAYSWPKCIFVTRVGRRFCGTVADRTARKSIFLTKIVLVFARAARGGAVRNWFGWIGQPSSRLGFHPPVCAAA